MTDLSSIIERLKGAKGSARARDAQILVAIDQIVDPVEHLQGRFIHQADEVIGVSLRLAGNGRPFPVGIPIAEDQQLQAIGGNVAFDGFWSEHAAFTGAMG